MRLNNKSEVANPGFVRPPLVYFSAVIAGLVIDRFWFIGLPLGEMGRLLGASASTIAAILLYLAQREFRVANTPIPGNLAAAAVVRTGPFSISRNPIYLAFSLLGTGIALWLGSLWVFITLIPAVGIMQFVVIPREERYMEAKFGLEYSEYKSSVRRWI